VSFKNRTRNVDFKQVTVTLEALGEDHGGSSVAVVTSDGAAWSWPDLFDQFAPLIRSFARSRGSSSPDDIVQDVFTSAIERFPRFDGDSTKLRSFLFTLAYRRIADEHRIRYRRQEQLVADHQPTADAGGDTEDAFTLREEAAEAMRALDILGERERRVIEMRIIEESSPSEVADALGLTNGNVRVIQARALMKIRKYLESRSGAMPSIGLVFAFLKGLRSQLPARGGVAEWIEMLQSGATAATAKTAAVGAGTAVATGAGSTATVAGTVLKIGLVVALATASTSSVDLSVTDHDPAGLPAVAPAVAPVVEDTGPTEVTGTAAVVEKQIPAIGISPNRPNPSRSNPGTERPTGDQVDTEAGEAVVQPKREVGPPPSVVDEVGGGVVEPGVNDVVETVEEEANGVVETVETVTTVVNDVVDTVAEVVDDTVNNTVDTVVDTVDDTTNTVDDTVDPVVDDVVDTVDSVVGGVSGFLER
jgi:RNA polymerase sigma-70 factor (ECF subfamily)